MTAEVYDADAGGVVQTRRAETHADIAIILRAKRIQIRAIIVAVTSVFVCSASAAVVLQVLVVAVLAAEGGGGAVSVVSVVIRGDEVVLVTPPQLLRYTRRAIEA